MTFSRLPNTRSDKHSSPVKCPVYSVCRKFLWRDPAYGAFGWPSQLPVAVLLLSVGVSSTLFPADVNISRSFFLSSSTYPILVLGFHCPNKQMTHFWHLRAVLWEFLELCLTDNCNWDCAAAGSHLHVACVSPNKSVRDFGPLMTAKRQEVASLCFSKERHF